MTLIPSRLTGKSLRVLIFGLCLLSARAEPDSDEVNIATTAGTTDQVVSTVEGLKEYPGETSKIPSEKEEVKGLLKLGQSLTDRADYEAGEIAYRQVLKLTTEDEEVLGALFGLAKLHRKQGSLIKSIAIYQRMIKDYKDDPLLPDALLELGRAQREIGAHKSALSSFYSVINSTLKIPANQFDHYQLLAKTAQFEIAETHFMAGNFTEAAKFFTRVRLLDLAPNDRARAHFKSAYAQQLGGQLSEAVVTLKAFIEQHPQDENVPEARYLRSTILRKLNRSEEALASTLELLRLEQSHTQTNPRRWAFWQRRTGNQLANEFFAAGDTINALAIYLSLTALSEDIQWRLPIVYQTALCYERLRQIDEAKHAYESIIETINQQEEVPPGDELANLLRMSTWRLDHISWRDTTDRQLSNLFETITGKTPAILEENDKEPSHDSRENT